MRSLTITAIVVLTCSTVHAGRVGAHLGVGTLTGPGIILALPTVAGAAPGPGVTGVFDITTATVGGPSPNSALNSTNNISVAAESVVVHTAGTDANMFTWTIAAYTSNITAITFFLEPADGTGTLSGIIGPFSPDPFPGPPPAGFDAGASFAPPAANNLACHLAERDPPELELALSLVNNLAERWPNYAHFRDTRGRILAKMGRWEDALVDLQAALPQLTSYRPIHETLADVYSQLGMKKLAEEHHNAALMLPTEEEYRQAIASQNSGVGKKR